MDDECHIFMFPIHFVFHQLSTTGFPPTIQVGLGWIIRRIQITFNIFSSIFGNITKGITCQIRKWYIIFGISVPMATRIVRQTVCGYRKGGVIFTLDGRKTAREWLPLNLLWRHIRIHPNNGSDALQKKMSFQTLFGTRHDCNHTY